MHSMCSHGRFVMLRHCKGYRHTGQSPGMRACREVRAVSMCARFEYLAEFETRAQQQQQSPTWISNCKSVFYLRLCSLWIKSGQTTRHCVDLGENISVFHDHNSTQHSVCLGEGGHHGCYVCLWLWGEIIVICGRCGLVLEFSC